MTTRFWLTLLIAGISLIMLASAFETTSTSTTLARPYETSELPQKHVGTSAPIQDGGGFLKTSWTSDKVSLWKVHIALQLVKRPRLNEQQARVLLDAISLSDSEFLAPGTPANNGKADALQALRQRAFAAFPKKEVAEIFSESEKNEDDILKMYYDISALALPERKASFRKASTNDKSNLWRTHLALFLVKRPELNEWQKQIIMAAMSLATPEYFEVGPASPTWSTKVRAPLRSLEEQILAAFSFEDGAKIFATLGDDSEAAKRTPTQAGSFSLSGVNYKQLSDSGPYKERSGTQFGNQDRSPRAGGACTCSTQSDWCPLSGYCNSSGNCNTTGSGCGSLWRYPCDGACQ